MNITFLAPCKDLSGGIKVIATYGNKLIDLGHSVTVAYPKSTQSLARRLKRSLIKTIKNQKDHLDRFEGTLLAVSEFSNQTIPDGDVLIATAWETAEWSQNLAESKGAKFYFIQGHEVWNGQTERVYDTLKQPMKKITISNWLQTLLTEVSGDKDITMIPNASDFGLGDDRGFASEPNYDLGMTYSSIPNKGSDLGLEAIRQIAVDHPNLRVVLFGTEMPSEMLPFNVDMYEKPSQKKIQEIYQSTAIWLSTSYEEGFCLPCLEAMSSGAVVVSTDNKGVRDIIDHEKNGFITPTGEVSDLVERIDFLLTHPTEFEEYQKAGLQKSASFSWDKSALMMEQTLQGASQ